VVLQTPAAMPEAVEREQLYFPLPYIRSDWIAKMKRYGYHKISTSYLRNIATLANSRQIKVDMSLDFTEFTCGSPTKTKGMVDRPAACSLVLAWYQSLKIML